MLFSESSGSSAFVKSRSVAKWKNTAKLIAPSSYFFWMMTEVFAPSKTVIDVTRDQKRNLINLLRGHESHLISDNFENKKLIFRDSFKNGS